jgi:putative colanic acid biosynthesis acetyltransferase WcaF
MTATNPISFQNPHSVKNRMGRLAWNIFWAIFFRPTPWFMGAYRTWLLKLWGAKIEHARFHSSARVWAPWLLKCGKNVYIDRNVFLYNTYGLELGDRVIVSFGTVLCTPTHDFRDPSYPLVGRKITVRNDVWIAAEAFVMPGVTIGEGAIVGARAVVAKDVEPWTVVTGNPAQMVRRREMKSAGSQSGGAEPSGPRAKLAG